MMGGRMTAHEFRDMGHCLAGFREIARLKHMGHARPNFELSRDPCGPCPGRQANAVVANDLVLPDLDEQWWDAPEVAENGGGKGETGARIPEI